MTVRSRSRTGYKNKLKSLVKVFRCKARFRRASPFCDISHFYTADMAEKSKNMHSYSACRTAHLLVGLFAHFNSGTFILSEVCHTIYIVLAVFYQYENTPIQIH